MMIINSIQQGRNTPASWKCSKKIRAAGDKYGQMVHRVVDYILDDEDAF